jgi:hypothetical protein
MLRIIRNIRIKRIFVALIFIITDVFTIVIINKTKLYNKKMKISKL